MGCTLQNGYWFVCLHVIEQDAKPFVYPNKDEEGGEGEILCAACDKTSQRPGGWEKLSPVFRALCSHCCELRWNVKALAKGTM
jgi:hypothetical protein